MTWRRANDRLYRLDGNEHRLGIASVGWSMNYTVVAQLQPCGRVRAMVIGIGPKAWAFTPARAAIKYRRAFPETPASEITMLVNQLQTLAEAAIAPIRDALGAVPVQPAGRPSLLRSERHGRMPRRCLAGWKAAFWGGCGDFGLYG